MVKKIAIWIVVIIIGIIAFAALDGYKVQKDDEAFWQEREARFNKLQKGCENNNSTDCYKLGMSYGYSEGEAIPEERREALAKGCQLGNKDACREGGYYEKGCELKDGESCYELAKNESLLFVFDEEKKNKSHKQMKEYYKKACDYGYSQGCMEK